jgi:hypothetical protein
MYSQRLTLTKQLPELEASLEVSFGLPKFELSSIIAASGTWKTDETIKHMEYKAARIKQCCK